jgi:uracil-DNA glycosylase
MLLLPFCSEAQMPNLGNFPFGESVQTLYQKERTPKKVFVLGVYASAVHAKWLDTTDKVIVRALAVASEPYIFWTGEGAADIVSRINLPPEAGTLVPADKQFNGPSGNALDDKILKPLEIVRKDAWLCDLVPYSCINPAQKKTVITNYEPLVKKKLVQPVTTKPVPSILATAERVKEITKELMESKAEYLILLGDQPIKWFLSKQWKKLSDFGEDEKSYGTLHPVIIEGRTIQVLPLAHPRQIAKLGLSSDKWNKLHSNWIKNTASKLLNK